MESHNIWSFVIGFFKLAYYCQVHPCHMYQLLHSFYDPIVLHGLAIPHFVQLSVDRHLSYFHYLAIMNNATVNFHRHIFSVFLGIYPGMKLIDHMISLSLTFWEATKLFSKVTVAFYTSWLATYWSFQFIHILDTCYCQSLIIAILVLVNW